MSLGAVFDAALMAQRVCGQLGLRNCVIGGIALQRWGEPRFTADADLSVMVDAGQESRVIHALLESLSPRIADAADFALRSRVVLAQTAQGVGIDIVLAGLPFEENVMLRSSPWDIGKGERLVTASAEDLIVMKAFAGRDKDWADVTGILERQGANLDLDLIRRELRPLLEAKEAPELAEELERRIARHHHG